jgi:phage shock protein PspC (stress-responsive transcriptional regulator)
VNAEPISRPSLRRRVDQRLVAGVVGGIADSLNAPVGILRVLLVLASPFSVWILVGYAIAALVIPPRGRNRPGWDNLVGLGRFAVLWAVPAAVFAGTVSNEDFFTNEPGLWLSLLALELVGLAVVLSSTYPRGPSEAQARATVLGAMPLAGFAALVGAGVALFPDFRWECVIPVGAVVAGAVLVVGARRGSWRPLVGPAVVASLLAAVTVASGLRLDGGVGDRVFRTAGASPPTQRLAVGDLRVVVAPVSPTGTATVRANVGVGTLRVVVPRQARVSIDSRVGRGQISVGGDREGGVAVRVVKAATGDLAPLHLDRPAGRVRVIAEVGIGNVDVHRADEEDAWF